MLKSLRRAGPALLMLAPSLILVGVFVYGLIGANFQTSITDNHTAAQATGQKPSVVVWFEGIFEAYEENRRERLGAAADRPHRITYKKLVPR